MVCHTVYPPLLQQPLALLLQSHHGLAVPLSEGPCELLALTVQPQLHADGQRLRAAHPDL